MELAIDTSTETASLAAGRDGEILAEWTWRCGLNHTTQLLPHIERLLEQAQLKMEDVKGIIVARGPGSFNGLRVGVSTAKGLAFSLKIPIVGISTLETMAYQHAAYGLPVCAILNAGREELAVAVYQMKRKQWTQIAPEHLTTLSDLCDQTTMRMVFTGEFQPWVADEIKKRLPRKAVIPGAAARMRRGGFLAELGHVRLAAGETDSVTTLAPIYLRRPPITERKAK